MSDYYPHDIGLFFIFHFSSSYWSAFILLLTPILACLSNIPLSTSYWSAYSYLTTPHIGQFFLASHSQIFATVYISNCPILYIIICRLVIRSCIVVMLIQKGSSNLLILLEIILNLLILKGLHLVVALLQPLVYTGSHNGYVLVKVQGNV